MFSIRSLVLCAVPLFPLAAFASETQTQPRNVSGFEKIRIEGAVDTQIREGAFAVQVTAEPDEQKNVITRVEGDTLVIETRDEHHWLHHRGEVSASITLPHFRAVSVDGAGDVTIEGVHAGAVGLAIHGAGNIDFAGQAKTVAIELTGAGSVTFGQGHVDSLSVDLSGAGNVRARQLVTRDANVDLRGAGSVDLTADGGALSLGMHGIGSIHWYGTASALSTEADGLGTIQHG